MGRSTLIVSFLLVSVYLGAQETRPLAHFSEIYVATGIQVKLVEGNQTKAVISVEGGEDSEVITDISDSRLLTIKFDSGVKMKRRAKVTLYCHEKVNKLSVATAATIYSSDAISGEEMVLEGETGGKIDVALDVDKLSLDLSSGSIVTLMGVAKMLDSEVSSGAALHAFELQTEKINAECSSGGNMEIYAVDEISAKCSLGGKIVYAGRAQINKDEMSSGTILPKE